MNFIRPFKLFITDKNLSIDIVFFSILLITIPIVLITGPALPDIFLSLIAFYFLVISILKKKWYYYKNPLVYGFLIFSIYGIIRSLFSENLIESLTNEGSVFYFRYIFFAMGVWYLLDNNSHISKCLLIVSIFCLTLVCIDGLYQYFVGINFFGNEKFHVDRLTGFFGKEPIIGRYISFLSIFTFALIYQNYNKTKKTMISSILLLVACEVIVFLTGERAALFYVSLYALLILIFIPRYRIYRIIGLFISVIIILGILQINPTAKSRMVDTTIEQVTQTKIPYLPYSSHHEEHYVSALKMFIDNPLFGVGTNTFRIECKKPEYKYKKRSCSSHPHHIYLQTLAELGIVGFLFLATFFLYISIIGIRQLFMIIKSDKNKQIPFEYFLYAMILFVYWWPIIPHMSLYNNWNNVLLMLPMGYFMKYFYGNK